VEAVGRHYDELDRFYRELWGENLHHGLWQRGDEDAEAATENLTGLVAQRARLQHGDRVCDVGCGYGGPARAFATRWGAEVVGLTVSEEQQRHAVRRAEGDPRQRFMVRNWLESGLPEHHFDAVVAIESSSHMPDHAAFLSECRRVLKPGGRLVIAAWLCSESPASWKVRHLLRPICDEGRLAGLPTESEYRGWLDASGLRLLLFDDLSHAVRRTWSVCVRRVGERLLGDPAARRYLLDPNRTERVFALAVARIWLAYRVGALRYGVMTATRD
jgi:tocopherol O-methyltransferase